MWILSSCYHILFDYNPDSNFFNCCIQTYFGGSKQNLKKIINTVRQYSVSAHPYFFLSKYRMQVKEIVTWVPVCFTFFFSKYRLQAKENVIIVCFTFLTLRWPWMEGARDLERMSKTSPFCLENFLHFCTSSPGNSKTDRQRGDKPNSRVLSGFKKKRYAKMYFSFNFITRQEGLTKH